MRAKKMIFISTSCFIQRSSVISVLKEYAKQGIKNIELGASHKYEEGIIEFLKDYRKKYGAEFTLHGYFPPQKDSLIVNFASQNEASREKSIAHVKNMIDLSKELGAKLCGFHAGFLVDTKQLGQKLDKAKRFDYEKGYGTFLSSVKEVCNYASIKSVKIAFEPNVVSSYNVIDGKNELLLMCEIKEIKRFYHDLEMSGIKNLGMILDLGHLKVTANNLKYDPVEFIETFKNNVLEIHIHDNDGFLDKHLQLKKDSWALKMLKKVASKKIIVTLEAEKLDLEKIASQFKLLSAALANENK